MKTQRFLPVLATVILAGTMFLAGCEKEKKTEDISESNYNTIPLEEYLEGTWICPQSAGPGINWTDTFVFNHETWFNNCSNQYRKYLASGFDYLYDKVGMYDCLRDVICGYRADDSYFSYARDFLSNNITLFIVLAMIVSQTISATVITSQEARDLASGRGRITTDALCGLCCQHELYLHVFCSDHRSCAQLCRIIWLQLQDKACQTQQRFPSSLDDSTPQ